MTLTTNAASATAQHAKRPVTFTNAAPYFIILFLLALVAFWPSYLSTPGTATGYTHFHAVTAATWMLMLVVQPLAVRKRRLGLHRALGRTSYVIAPLVVIGMVLLAHTKTQGVPSIELPGFYVPLSLAGLFGLSYALAIATRRTTALHARFMVCTALTLIDPVVVRLLFWAYATPSFRYQWITFPLTDLVFVALIWRERRSRGGRAVFPTMLLVFALAQLVFLLDVYQLAPWQAFMRWFAALPLT
jgi:hypothetical protein